MRRVRHGIVKVYEVPAGGECKAFDLDGTVDEARHMVNSYTVDHAFETACMVRFGRVLKRDVVEVACAIAHAAHFHVCPAEFRSVCNGDD